MDLVKPNNKFTVTVKHETDTSLVFTKTLSLDFMSKEEIIERVNDVFKNCHLDIDVEITNKSENEYEVSFSGEVDYNLFIELYLKFNAYSYSMKNINCIIYRTLPDDERKRMEVLKEYWKSDSNKNKYIYCISLVDSQEANEFFDDLLDKNKLPCLIITHSEPCYTWGSVYDCSVDDLVLRNTGSDVLLIEEENKCGVIIDTQLELERNMPMTKVIEYILDDIRFGSSLTALLENTHA